MNIKKHRILIFPAGSEIGLEIYKSLKYNHHVEVFGASGKNDHASFVYEKDHYIESPKYYMNHPDFIKHLAQLIESLQIEFIYPTHDDMACFLAEHQEELTAQVLTSCKETNYIARHKEQTYEVFQGFDFCPRLFSEPYQDLPFPLFLKPDTGQGGKGSYIARNKADLDFYLGKDPGLLVTEFLPGDELSVDCFTDFNRSLLFVGPRTRERIQMGISFRSTMAGLTDEIQTIAEQINQTVLLNGAWFFQVKKDYSGKFKLMEFAPRQASTMGVYRYTGVNFALLSYFNAQRIPVQILQNNQQVQLDRCLHNRFKTDITFQKVYIDFDETLYTGNHVHELVMAFLYQCRNNKIPVVLLTKHRYDVHETLRTCGISEHLFEEIVCLSEVQDKWMFIDPNGAIFIDNYWIDRQIVKEKLRIPVFDVDTVECLLV